MPVGGHDSLLYYNVFETTSSLMNDFRCEGIIVCGLLNHLVRNGIFEKFSCGTAGWISYFGEKFLIRSKGRWSVLSNKLCTSSGLDHITQWVWGLGLVRGPFGS